MQQTTVMEISQRISYIQQYIGNRADERLVELVYGLIEADRIKAEGSTDWWDEISEDEKASIERGLEQARNGQTRPHDEVMKEVRARFQK